MNQYVCTIKNKQYIIYVERHKQYIFIYVNRKKIFNIDFLDRESNKKFFYTINIEKEEITVSIEYYIPENDFRVSFKTDCYLNGKSLIDNKNIDSFKYELIRKTEKGFKTYIKDNGKSIIKDTVKEMVLGSIFGWGVAGFILQGIKKQLLMILVMPFFSTLLGFLMIFVSYLEDKRFLKHWDEQYIKTVYF